jgi:heptosyltransferase II
MPRSLIVAPQWIGDAVMTQPLLARLAAAGHHLTVGALPWVAPVYRAMPEASAVLDWPLAHGPVNWRKRWQLAKTLRGQFDMAYVLPNSLKSALIPWLAGIPQRLGYHGESRYGLLHQRLPNPPRGARPAMVAHYSALAGHPVPAGERPQLKFSAEALRAATAAAKLLPGAYWVFAPGAEYGPAKCWPAAHYAALARALWSQHQQPILLLGSGKEVTLCEQIAQAAPQACQVLAGKTSLLNAMQLIASARGLVSNDSGLMHVGAALGTPQVALFGSTSPQHTPPLNGRAQVVWLKEELHLDCSPCFERTCRFGHTRCLYEMTPERVQLALSAALAAEVGG